MNEVSGQMTEIVKTNGNGYDKLLPLAAIILALIGLFWSVANPRDDIKEIKQELQAEIDKLGRDKLTIAENREYALRKDKDTDRIDGEINSIRAGWCHDQNMSSIGENNLTRLTSCVIR